MLYQNCTSLTLEISDGTTWSEVSTLTSSPWVTYLDSTIYPNGTYTLRATAFDSTAGENVVQIGDSFSIANQVPEIIQFEVLNPDYGTGSSASDRAWFNIDATDTLLRLGCLTMIYQEPPIKRSWSWRTGK